MSLKKLLIPTLNQVPMCPLLASEPEGYTIPRIIHQTFYDRQLTPELQANVDRLRTMNPGWEYRFYDDDDVAAFIKENYPPLVWERFQRIDPRYGAARADLFRYLVIYKLGGVYFDIKSCATRPLDEVIRQDDRFLLSKWHRADGQYETYPLHYDLLDYPGGEYQQWHIVSSPGHPFLKAVIETTLANIDLYDPYLHETSKRGVLRLTGPIMYTLTIHRLMPHHPHRVVDSLNELGFEYNVYPNQSHQNVFKSHYSTQTASIVRMMGRKRALSQLYRLLQYVHNVVRRSRTNPAGVTQ